MQAYFIKSFFILFLIRFNRNCGFACICHLETYNTGLMLFLFRPHLSLYIFCLVLPYTCMCVDLETEDVSSEKEDEAEEGQFGWFAKLHACIIPSLAL